MSEFRRPSNLGLVGLLISEQPTARHVVQSVVDNGDGSATPWFFPLKKAATC